ncbi:MAG: TraB/GumN family protein [Bacteroidetes bacterium]|uniref:TraB/GumN family protein n=1 Tax=Phnomibacter sp. TaxID=2836217 RepID=UPI002FDCE566|nr:TraB/GumN family protein [Bacteroidota bacterium]
MKKNIISPLVSFFSLLFLGCTAQAPIAENSTPQTLLWRISGNQLAKPSYLFGTMHIMCAKDAIVSSQLQQVLDSTKQVYFEVDLDNMVEMIGSIKAMAMKDGKGIRDFLTQDEYDRVAAYFQGKSPLPFKVLERYKPLLLSAMIAEQAMQCEATNGMEMMILAEAAKRKKEILGLETMSYQAGLFDSIPYATQAKELLKAIDSAGVDNTEVQQLLEAYKAQDLEKINALTIKEEGSLEGNLDLLLYGRNRNWVQKMPALMKESSNLFAVGAGHLPGENGVIQLLRNAGYTLTPLLNEMKPSATAK